MKEIKNKEVIIGLILLIILLATALVLIIRRETRQMEGNPVRHVAEEGIDSGQDEPLLATDEETVRDVSVQAAVEKESDIKKQDDLEAEKDDVNAMNSDSVSVGNADQTFIGTAALQSAVSEFSTEPVLSDRVFGEEIRQLEELYYYWNEYKLDAVADLIRLPRVRTEFTNELSGTNEFYYYGGINTDGKPDGTGVAVYENNAYYCGEWKNGKRHGNGMWLQIFPDKPATINGITGVTEHSYNGEWKDDYPNGSGQEHYEYDAEEMSEEEIITNVIGSFKDGYYNGELYIMTVQGKNSSIDWEAKAQNGEFVYRHERYNTVGRRAVWEMMKKEEGTDEFYWIEESENKNWGIFGLKKMN